MTAPARTPPAWQTFALLVLLATPAAADAQAPRARVGLGLGGSLLVGEGGSDFLDSGITRWITAQIRLDDRDHFHVRIDLEQTPLEPHQSSPNAPRATNTLYTLAAGPQLSATLGPVRPHVGGLIGWGLNRWDTGAESGTEAAAGFGGMAGLAVDLTRGRIPVALMAEARLFNPGSLLLARSVTPGSGLSPTSSVDVAVLSIRAGVLVGF